MVENLFKNKYYLVTHKFHGLKYIVAAPSKKKLAKMLPKIKWAQEACVQRKHLSRRFYHLWSIKEIDEKKYMKMSQNVGELTWEYTYEDKNDSN